MSNQTRRKAPSRSRPAAGSSRNQSQNPMMVGVVAIVAVVVVGVAIAALISLRSSDDSVFEYNGVALPVYTGAGDDPAYGLKAPIVVTADFDGNRLVVGSGGGPNDPTTVFGFFAHWCPTCQAEVPPIAEWLRDNDLPDGVQVVAVSTFENSGRDNHPPSDWFAAVDWPTTVLVDTDDADIARLYGMEGVPGWVVLDEFNRVIHRQTGALGVDGFAALVRAAEEQVG